MKYFYSLLTFMCWSVLFLCFLNSAQAQTFTGNGSGTAEDPFLIETNADLIKLTTAYESWDLHYKLTADLDMDGETFYPIGYKLANNVEKTFNGVFDGNFHTISNLIITPNPEQTTIGLGFVGSARNATVKNLGLINVSTPDKSKARVGGIIGLAENTTYIDRCFVLGGTIRGNGHVAGIVGQMNGHSVTNCISDVTLISNNWGMDAGIAGNIQYLYSNTAISQCINLGDQKALVADSKLSVEPNIDYSGLYARTTSNGANESTKVSVLSSLEMTNQTNFPNLDFSDDGAWVMRDNSYPILKGFALEAFASIKQYPGIPLIVTSDGTTPIEGATITIDETNYTTNAQGKVDDLLEDGSYDFTINADGYKEYTGSFLIDDNTEISTITLITEGVTTYSATFTVKNNKQEIVEGASFRLYITDGYDQTEITDSNGQVTFELLLGDTYQYSINKTLHIETNDQILVDQNIDEVVTLNIDNKKPVAVVQAGRTIESGEVVFLHGAASYDENNDPLTYKWTAPEGIQLANENNPITTFTVPNVDVDTPMTFTLVVNDGENDSDAASVTFTAKNTILYGLNLIKNGGFEEALNVGWEGLDNFTPSEVVPADSKGLKSLKIETTSQIDLVQTNPESFMELEVGQSYKFTGKFRVDRMTTTVYNFRLMPSDQWRDADNTKFSITRNDLSWGDAQPVLNEWVAFEKTLVIDETFKTGASIGDKVMARVYFQSPNITTDELIYFDDLSLVKADITMDLKTNEDQTVLPGTKVDLMAMHNSSNVFTYTWKAPEGITLTSTDQMSTSFTAPNDISEITDLDFMVTATTGNLTFNSTVKVTVLESINAMAGQDQTVTEGDLVTLDASATSPSSAMISWKAPKGIQLSSLTDKMPTFTAPSVQEVTSFTFMLTAKIGEREATDEVMITVEPDLTPIANAGSPQNAFSGKLVTLDASLSEAKTDNSLTYHWVAPEGITLSDVNAVMPTFTAPEVNEATDYTFKLTVVDGENSSEETTVTVTVLKAKLKGKDLIVNGGFEDEITVGWKGISQYTRSDVVSTKSEGLNSLLIEEEDRIDALQTNDDSYFDLEIGKTYTFSGRFRVDRMNAAVFNIRIMPFDEWPAVDNYKLAIGNTDITWGDYQAVIGEWVYFEKEILIDEEYTINDVNNGDIVASRIYIQSPTDVQTTVYFDDFSLVESNFEFVLNAGNDVTIQAGGSVELIASQNSAEEFTYTWSAPEGISLSATEGITTTATATEALTAVKEYTITLTAQNDKITATDEVKVTVTPEIKVNAGENQEAKMGTTVTLDGSQTTPADATLVWTAPEGITLSDVNSAMPTFTAPNVSEEMTYTFTLTAQYLGNEATSEVNVLVYPELVADAGTSISTFVGEVVTLDASATVPTNAALTWSAPEGIVLSDVNATMPTFTAPEVSEETTYTFTLSAEYKDMTTTDEVTVTISPNELPVANAGADQVVEIGDVVTLDASASTPETVTFEWLAPEGITLSDATVSKPTFTAPDVSVETTFTFVVKVSIGDVVVLDEVKITVNAPEEIPTSIEDTKIVTSVFPNPTTDQVTIELVENAEVIILNLQGASIFKKEFRAGQQTLDVSDFKTGLYIIQVKTSNAHQSVKLIKE
ncbi:T9SS type A sorting domain-containing protein [Flammeovirga sp. EKP202]|uniref:PKD domain-containing protein n=1 Tax=Flammeovirga sp. EKP202 TaxID=2770592 RepID=UPI00165FEDFA|nr:T9SS type A sorting domain-containing protein [Flammeovirga sp. EKP202]MBD0401543.1 T9SS type A sorting domain-containing protein [Flammeovirga sp. EKP202]